MKRREMVQFLVRVGHDKDDLNIFNDEEIEEIYIDTKAYGHNKEFEMVHHTNTPVSPHRMRG